MKSKVATDNSVQYSFADTLADAIAYGVLLAAFGWFVSWDNAPRTYLKNGVFDSAAFVQGEYGANNIDFNGKISGEKVVLGRSTSLYGDNLERIICVEKNDEMKVIEKNDFMGDYIVSAVVRDKDGKVVSKYSYTQEGDKKQLDAMYRSEFDSYMKKIKLSLETRSENN